jgi:gamma-D-glutamyl-L-lysine dipeptidyl-peptidase
MPYDPRHHIVELRGTELVTTEGHDSDALRAAYPGTTLKLLPDLALGGRTSGYVEVAVAPLRALPAHSSEQISQLQLGWPVDVLEAAGNDWFRIRAPDRYIGYMHRQQLHIPNPCWNTGYKALQKVLVVAKNQVVYARPDLFSEPVCDLSAGALLGAYPSMYIKEHPTGWLKVSTPGSQIGYVKEGGLEAMDKPIELAPAQWLAIARQLLGVPYLWGGTTPRGLDCSGLIQHLAWLQAGHHIPRDASQQAQLGQHFPPDLAQLLSGDLLFFGDEPARITHVALYEGEGIYIHASGCVRRNALTPHHALFEPHRFATWQHTQRL